MKYLQTGTSRTAYLSPEIESYDMILENGFAASGTAGIDPLDSETNW